MHVKELEHVHQINVMGFILFHKTRWPHIICLVVRYWQPLCTRLIERYYHLLYMLFNVLSVSIISETVIDWSRKVASSVTKLVCFIIALCFQINSYKFIHCKVKWCKSVRWHDGGYSIKLLDYATFRPVYILTPHSRHTHIYIY